jgi:hypothetical protein
VEAAGGCGGVEPEAGDWGEGAAPSLAPKMRSLARRYSSSRCSIDLDGVFVPDELGVEAVLEAPEGRLRICIFGGGAESDTSADGPTARLLRFVSARQVKDSPDPNDKPWDGQAYRQTDTHAVSQICLLVALEPRNHSSPAGDADAELGPDPGAPTVAAGIVGAGRARIVGVGASAFLPRSCVGLGPRSA